MNSAASYVDIVLNTARDVLPIAVVLFGVQIFVLKQPIPHLKRTILGFLYVLAGLALFLIGLDQALFPLGRLMAAQLTDPRFLMAGAHGHEAPLTWTDYGWVYAFAAAIGFATTIAEPALIAVAIKAQSVSGRGISVWGLRIAVAIGVAMGIALGTFRIVTGTPLQYYILAGYAVVIAQTFLAPREIIAIAYDSGGVTTSTVTVPLVTALGLGLANAIPGRSPLIDGFGLIAFASLFPMITVMGYAQLAVYRERMRAKRRALASRATDSDT
jgi:hypothetical protein